MAKLTAEQKEQRGKDAALREALKAEERDRRDRENRERWRREGLYSTWEEALAGGPCKGCGRPLDDGKGAWGGTMYMTAEMLAEYEAENALFRERHGDCQAMRWSLSGSRTTHCGACCPPLPLSPDQLTRLRSILAGASRSARELTTWALELRCGHETRATQHRDHDQWLGGRVKGCPVCRSPAASCKQQSCRTCRRQLRGPPRPARLTGAPAFGRSFRPHKPVSGSLSDDWLKTSRASTASVLRVAQCTTTPRAVTRRAWSQRRRGWPEPKSASS